MEGLGTLPCFFLFEQVVDAKGRLVQREKGGHVPIPSRAQGEGGDPNPKEQGSFCEKAVLLRREKEGIGFAAAMEAALLPRWKRFLLPRWKRFC